MQKTMAHGSLEHFSKNRDYTGFTKQTSLLLDGLNASHLLKKFKARNISTKELGQLTLEDLKALGADEDLANELTLQFSRRNVRDKRPSGEDEESKLLDVDLSIIESILRNSTDQLSNIEMYLSYSLARMSERQINFFIDRDKNVLASRALGIAASDALEELDELEKSLNLLHHHVTPGKVETRRMTKVCLLTGGIGITVYLVVRLWRYNKQ